MSAPIPFQTLSKLSFPDDKRSSEKHRDISLQVQTALNRLQHNLQMLPKVEDSTAEETRRMKLQVIDDVIRTMGTPELLKDFLVNCDLVAKDPNVLTESEIERAIVKGLSKETLLSIAEEITKDIEKLRMDQRTNPQLETSEDNSRRVFILCEIARRLSGLEGAQQHDFIESFLNRAVVSADDLSPEVRQAVETECLVDTFLARKGEYLESLEQISQDEAGKEAISVVGRVLPELVQRQEYSTAAKIVEVINAGQSQSPLLEGLRELLSGQLADLETVRRLVKDMNCQDKERRNQLVEILAFIGDPAGAGLLEVYAKSDSKPIRMSVFDVVRRIGAQTLQSFLIRLPEIEPDGLMIFHIIEAAGLQDNPFFVDPISRFCDHPSPHVRRAALTALFKLEGPSAESHFLHALRDREAAVRQVAVELLGRINSRHPEALLFYLKGFQAHDPASPPAESDAVLIEVCKTLAATEMLPSDYISKAENILLSIVRPPEPRKLLDRWLQKKPPPQPSEQLRIAICQALAEIGTRAAVDPLSQTAASSGGAVAESAAQAAKQIQQRYADTPQQDPP